MHDLPRWLAGVAQIARFSAEAWLEAAGVGQTDPNTSILSVHR